MVGVSDVMQDAVEGEGISSIPKEDQPIISDRMALDTFDLYHTSPISSVLFGPRIFAEKGYKDNGVKHELENRRQQRRDETPLPSKPEMMEDRFGNKVPYLDLGVKVMDMISKQFKASYKGEHHEVFKYIKSKHNAELAGSQWEAIIDNLYRGRNWDGIVYKITQIKDENGNLIEDGPIRIGKSTVLLSQRKAKYVYKASTGFKGKKYHIHNAIAKYGIDAFEFEIIAVCTSSKELYATEKFWTLFYNRVNNENGFDLNINEYYNPIVGDLMEDTSEKIPKYDLTKEILKGLEVRELMEKYHINTYETLENLFEKYYDTRKLIEVRTILIKPVLERSLKMGLDRDQAFQAIIDSGIFFVDKFDWQDSLINKYCKDLWGKTYDQLRLDFFVNPYIAYLQDLGFEIGDRADKNTIGLIELLVLEGLGEVRIARKIGLTTEDSTNQELDNARKRVRAFIRIKWGKTRKELYEFLKTNYLGINIRDTYINNL